MMEIHREGGSVLARWLTFIVEREQVRLRRAANLPREQWTDDPLIRDYKFTNVRPADDRVSRWYQTNWLLPHKDVPYAWFSAPVHVLINWPATEAEPSHCVDHPRISCGARLREAIWHSRQCPSSRAQRRSA
jgi:hypothetical protein